MHFRWIACSTLLMLFLAAPAYPNDEAGDGFLSWDIDILVYPSVADFESTDRMWILKREITQFEGYLWRHSSRRLSVHPNVRIIHRDLLPEEFRDYGRRFGFLLDKSAGVTQDLDARGSRGPASVFLLYDPPQDRPSHLAGRTFFEDAHSSIPLRDSYFIGDGFSLPLHLVLVHEFLHQIDLAFSRIEHPSEFLDPDGVGEVAYPGCIQGGAGDLSMRSLLKYDRTCEAVDWPLLAPRFGVWTER